MSGQTFVRIAEPADAPAFAAIYAPIVAETAISFETEPPNAGEMAQRITRTLTNYPWLTAVRDGQVAGYAYASQHRSRAAYRWSVDVTVYVADHARRGGVGAALYTALNDILRRQGFRSAFAGIALPNPGSIGLHEAMGFRSVGTYRDVGFKLGAWRDVGWWGLGLNGGADAPMEPIAFRDLADPLSPLPRP